jgi:3-methylcrotonyl-CoA carboxylase alpha subunit
MADESYLIPGEDPNLSYLSGHEIIVIAQQTNSEAIHPGYGFLSENAEFAKIVEESGIVFIGPSSDAIATMGLKDRAKSLMEKVGVPVVPGYHAKEQNNLEEIATNIGFPLIIKAIAGGGGRGMRLVDKPDEFQNLLSEAKSEALKFFGNDRVIIEKYIQKPRHIEVQVFGDGNRVIALFERDCSLQRRHQKIIEEAPAPGISSLMRKALCDAAVQTAEAVSYKGAGTVEFIVDTSSGLSENKFYFLEMNTRLQVEHSVTEAILKLDLVEWQLRVAFGGELPLRQDELKIQGHAIEARIYAEDVQSGFLPDSGTIEKIVYPENVRIDTGISEGDKISTYYDPMILKITAFADSRPLVIEALKRALLETHIMGVKTNLDFLNRLLNLSEFSKESFDTGLIGSNIKKLVGLRTPTTQVLALASIGVLGLSNLNNTSFLTGFTLWENLRKLVKFSNSQEEFQTEVECLGGARFIVQIEKNIHEINYENNGWTIDGKSTEFLYWQSKSDFSIISKFKYDFQIKDLLTVSSDNSDDDHLVIAPMPGQISEIYVNEGDSVLKGDRLVVLESMKMEHAISANMSGKIETILVSKGQKVDSRELLLRVYIKSGSE